MRAALLLAAALLVGCSADGPAPQRPAQPEAQPISAYVALGDSYTSGAGTPGSPNRGCRQAPGRYPALVAARLGATLADASCSGARTDNVTAPQPLDDGTAHPPQLDLVTPDADLVTIGLGFNDAGFLRNLTRAGRDRSHSLDRVPAIGRKVEAVVRLVHDRAPDARIVVVGYPQLVPATGACPELPLAPDEYAVARDALAALAVELGAVAERTGAGFVDVTAASGGHDVCAGTEAWVNGGRPQPGRAAPYHPFASEQEAVAALVLEEVG